MLITANIFTFKTIKNALIIDKLFNKLINNILT